MPELRKDPIVGRWVIISNEHVDGPGKFHSIAENSGDVFCPFCVGHEDKTPNEIMAFRDGTAPNGPGWSLRVIPNKFPVLQIEGSVDKYGDGMFDHISGVGAHELVLETAEHAKPTSLFSAQETENVIRAYLSRVRDLKNDTRLEYVQIVKNHSSSSSSINHSYSQLIALPVTPKAIGEELKGAEKYYSFKERCVYCDMIAQEKESRTRVILENADFIVIAPFASRSPFETWILPKLHGPSFEDMHDEKVVNLASALKDILFKLNIVLDNPEYSYVIHTCPFKKAGKNSKSYHWHVEIVPKSVSVSGLEWGTDMYINPTPPEDVTKFLRNIRIP